MTTSGTGLSSLSRHLRGCLIVPGDHGWDEARRPWNLRDQQPAAIVEPQGADDMATAVSFAARHGLQVSAQCSGHGAGADLADTILLRTRALREIIVDPARNLVRVAAGVRCRDLALAVAPHGLVASFGSGPSTGVAGYAMFGGAGALGRKVGFMASKVAAADVVTADGRPLRCDTEAHPDLLWSVRGGGGGYALVTHLELRLDRVPETFGGQVVWPAAVATDVWSAWRDWTASLPPEMTSSVDLISLPPLPEIPEPLRGKRVVTATACYAGPADRGAIMLSDLLARTARPAFNSCRPLAPADLANLWNAPSTPLPGRIRCELLTSLPDQAIGELLQIAGLGADSPIMLAQIRSLGGAFAQDPPGGGGAIGHCDAQYSLELLGMAPTPDAEETLRYHQHAITGALAPWTTGTVLPGFADPSADTAERIYPPQTRDRLRSVKARYDPGGILLTSFPT